MSQNDEYIAELQAYLVLLVQEAGGEVRIPYETVELGIQGGIRITPDEDAQELVFKLEVKTEDGQ